MSVYGFKSQQVARNLRDIGRGGRNDLLANVARELRSRESGSGTPARIYKTPLGGIRARDTDGTMYSEECVQQGKGNNDILEPLTPEETENIWNPFNTDIPGESIILATITTSASGEDHWSVEAVDCNCDEAPPEGPVNP